MRPTINLALRRRNENLNGTGRILNLKIFPVQFNVFYSYQANVIVPEIEHFFVGGFVTIVAFFFLFGNRVLLTLFKDLGFLANIENRGLQR